MDKWRDDAAAYALGALQRTEREEFEVHLLACAECAAEVRAFGQAAVTLAYALPPVSVRAGLRDRVIEAVTGTADPPVVMRTAPPPPPAAAPSRMILAPWLLAAASLVVAIGLGTYAVSLRRAASEARTVVVVLAASDLVRIEMAGQPVAPRAAARAFWSRSQGLVFTASNLPPLPSGRTYQVWIVTGQRPVGAGLVKPDAAGVARAVFTTTEDVSNPVALAVTVEPDGGVPAPTGDKYLVGLVN